MGSASVTEWSTRGTQREYVLRKVTGSNLADWAGCGGVGADAVHLAQGGARVSGEGLDLCVQCLGFDVELLTTLGQRFQRTGHRFCSGRGDLEVAKGGTCPDEMELVPAGGLFAQLGRCGDDEILEKAEGDRRIEKHYESSNVDSPTSSTEPCSPTKATQLLRPLDRGARVDSPL